MIAGLIPRTHSPHRHASLRTGPARTRAAARLGLSIHATAPQLSPATSRKCTSQHRHGCSVNAGRIGTRALSRSAAAGGRATSRGGAFAMRATKSIASRGWIRIACTGWTCRLSGHAHAHSLALAPTPSHPHPRTRTLAPTTSRSHPMCTDVCQRPLLTCWRRF